MKKKTTETDTLTIAFPSLIRRIGGEKAKALKLIAREHKCELKRIRRSRNWQLTGEANHLDEFAQHLKRLDVVTEFPFVAQKVTEASGPYQQASLPARLAELIINNPAITLSEMIEKTGCTIAQARLAREEEEL